jgi:hypothetical protein
LAVGLFVILSGLTFVDARWYVPETEGKTLEEPGDVTGPPRAPSAVATWD